jgi:hypothetical protein
MRLSFVHAHVPHARTRTYTHSRINKRTHTRAHAHLETHARTCTCIYTLDIPMHQSTSPHLLKLPSPLPKSHLFCTIRLIRASFASVASVAHHAPPSCSYSSLRTPPSCAPLSRCLGGGIRWAMKNDHSVGLMLGSSVSSVAAAQANHREQVKQRHQQVHHAGPGSLVDFSAMGPRLRLEGRQVYSTTTMPQSDPRTGEVVALAVTRRAPSYLWLECAV